MTLRLGRTSLPQATATNPEPQPRADAAGVRGRMNALLATPSLWVERHRTRRALAELDDHLLRDIGVTQAEAQIECAKPFWVP